MKNIDEIILDGKTVGISGHLRPDGDCVGSCMSLYNYLKKNRPDLTVKVYLEEKDPKFFLIDNFDDVDTNGYDGTIFDIFIALDTAGIDRLGINRPFFENAKRTVCIDHHKSNEGYGDYNYILPNSSSASETLSDLLDLDKFDASIAKPMYLGMAHDSGVFRFQSTTPHTMRIAAKMMEYDININEILEDTFYRKTYNQMLVTAKIQEESVLTLDGKCIYGFCTLKTMDEFNVTKSELDAVISSIRNVDGVEVAIFIYQLEEGKFKVSLRSKNIVDVSKIAVEFGGGGHIRAAGFDVEGELDNIIKLVVEKIQKEL